MNVWRSASATFSFAAISALSACLNRGSTIIGPLSPLITAIGSLEPSSSTISACAFCSAFATSGAFVPCGNRERLPLFGTSSAAAATTLSFAAGPGTARSISVTWIAGFFFFFGASSAFEAAPRSMISGASTRSPLPTSSTSSSSSSSSSSSRSPRSGSIARNTSPQNRANANAALWIARPTARAPLPSRYRTSRMRSGVATTTATTRPTIASIAVPAVLITARRISARCSPIAPPGPCPATRYPDAARWMRVASETTPIAVPTVTVHGITVSRSIRVRIDATTARAIRA